MVCLSGKDTPSPPVIGSGLGIYQGQNLLISEDQIVSYNRTSHVIKLTEDGLRMMRSKVLYEEVNGELVPQLDGLYLKTLQSGWMGRKFILAHSGRTRQGSPTVG